MNDINQVTMLGRVGKEVELKSTATGIPMARLSVANNTSVKTRDGYREEPSWFDWYAFGKTAEVLSRYVQKGDRILLSGRAKQSRWQDQNGKTQSRVEFIVSTYQFLEARRAAPDKTASAAMYGGEPHEPGDDMPF